MDQAVVEDASGRELIALVFLLTDISRIHIFTDLQPYICTFSDCKDNKVLFPSRKRWEEHEFDSHRFHKEYRCVVCKSNFPTSVDFHQHITNDHQETIRNSQEQALHKPLVLLVERDIEAESCPLCHRDGFKDRRSFVAHVGRHLEEIALISLPASDKAAEDSDEDYHIDESTKDLLAVLIHAGSDEMLNEIALTLEGFRRLTQEMDPKITPWLFERISQEQLRRYQRLGELKALHDHEVTKNDCVSGRLCFSQGEKTHHTDEEEQGTEMSDRLQIFKNQLPQGMPLPPISKWPAEFECNLCFRVVNVTKPSDWTKHIHEDLLPFTCTFPTCTVSQSYKRKTDWIRHENEKHRHLEWWSCGIAGCSCQFYRKDDFVQHLIKEHKLPEPRLRKRSARREEKIHDTLDQVEGLVAACRRETSKSPQDEPCQFCGLKCDTWTGLARHNAKHMERIALTVPEVFQKLNKTVEKESDISLYTNKEHEADVNAEGDFHSAAFQAISVQHHTRAPIMSSSKEGHLQSEKQHGKALMRSIIPGP